MKIMTPKLMAAAGAEELGEKGTVVVMTNPLVHSLVQVATVNLVTHCLAESRADVPLLEAGVAVAAAPAAAAEAAADPMITQPNTLILVACLVPFHLRN